jgi:uncharacterized protein (DUF433 family)
MILSVPDIVGSKPRIRGNRVGVHCAGWWKLGLSVVEQTGERLPTLSQRKTTRAWHIATSSA